MTDIDVQTFLEQAVLIGLLTANQAQEARAEAEDGSIESVSRALIRKDLLTAWQVERLKKGDPGSIHYGGCKVLFHIAEGTFARVYRGRKLIGNQSVAIKVLRNRFVADAGAIVRFNQEAESGLRLVHPNIVRIYEYGEQDKRYYMIMEFVEGSNLRDFLRIRGRLKVSEALPMMLGLAKGLRHSLEQGVTHRDLKATNILIASNGVAKLVDFGLATIDDERKAAAAHGQRTVDYSALERTCGSPKGDKRSDIFFLGCVFYQMLTGQLPLPEVETDDPLKKMLKRGINSIKPLSDQRHAPEPELSEIIERMMKVDLKARYQNMAEVVDELEEYVEQVAAKAAGIQRPRRVKPEDVVPEFITDEERHAYVDDEEEPTPRKPEPTGKKVKQPVALANNDVDMEEIFANRNRITTNAVTPPPVAAPAKVPVPAVFDDDDEDMEIPIHPESFEVKTIVPKKLLCVEAQEVVQEAFRKTLSKMGYRVLLVADAERAAERFRESPVDAVLFDADGLGPDSIDAFMDMHNKAHEDGHKLSALVLLGPRQHSLAKKLPTDDRLVVLPKPVKMKAIQDAISRLLPI